MSNSAEAIRGYVEEARICIEAAIAAGESVAVHGIVPSRDFEAVMAGLRSAAEALERFEADRVSNVVQLRIPAADR